MASIRSPLSEQQMQPLLNSTMSPSVETIRAPSMLTSPNSLTRTAVFSPRWLVRMWFTRVVLPLPRKPVMIVTGSFDGLELPSAAGWGVLMAAVPRRLQGQVMALVERVAGADGRLADRVAKGVGQGV